MHEDSGTHAHLRHAPGHPAGRWSWVGTCFPEMAFFELCILATILAATDAALGKGVITNMVVPSRIREGLNAESGLNDGLAVPILFLFIALATGAGSDQDSTAMALSLVARELGIGIVVGLGLTFV